MSAGATTLPSFWRQQLVDDAVLAYVAWREESATVWAAYRGWAGAASKDARGADAAYRAALDREEAAAQVYATLIERLSELLKTDGSTPASARARGSAARRGAGRASGSRAC
jgi:hypothetical protein